VKEIVDNAHHIALTILHENRELLEETAQELLQKEILEGNTLRERLGRAKAPDELGEWLRSGKISEDKPLMQSLLV
jgi:cell division protease FtsH